MTPVARKTNTLHVRKDGAWVGSVILRNEDGDELDLTPWKVSQIKRVITVGDYPTCEVTFFAHLIEEES